MLFSDINFFIILSSPISYIMDTRKIKMGWSIMDTRKIKMGWSILT